MLYASTSKSSLTVVDWLLKENAEEVKAVVEKNADAAAAVATFIETEPEAIVNNIVQTVSNKAEATKDAAAETAVNAKDAAVDAAVAAKDAAVDAAKQKVDEANAAVKQKAEETKAAAKKQANDAIDDAAKNVKKGLGL